MRSILQRMSQKWYYSPSTNTSSIYPIFIVFFGLFIFCSGCATTQFVAVPKEGVTVTPGGTFAIVGREGVTISAAHIKTPRSIRQITTFYLEIYNNTDETIEFIPKPYLLIDQNGVQYLAMGPGAISEASSSGRYHHAYIGLGYRQRIYHGWHHPYYPHHSFLYHPSYYYGRPYSGMLAKALPVRPITIQPLSKVTGNSYFAVNPSELTNVELIVSRFSEMPVKDQPEPRKIEYAFEFDEIQN